jgi:hypothetical protein
MSTFINAILFRHDGAEPEWIKMADEAHLAQMYKLIDCQMVDVYVVAPDLALYMDEEALLNDNRTRPNECLRRATGLSFYGNVLLCCCTTGADGHDKYADVTPLHLASLRATIDHDTECRAVYNRLSFDNENDLKV